jgi:hypothetical protein
MKFKCHFFYMFFLSLIVTKNYLAASAKVIKIITIIIRNDFIFDRSELLHFEFFFIEHILAHDLFQISLSAELIRFCLFDLE